MQHKRAQLKVRLYSTNSTTPLQPHNRQHHFFATSLSHGKPPPQFMPSHPLAPPISCLTPPPPLSDPPPFQIFCAPCAQRTCTCPPRP